VQVATVQTAVQDQKKADIRVSEREMELLINLSDENWRRPMDVGAWDGSHHSATLTRLAKRGLVERKKIHAIQCYFDSMHNGKRVTRCCCKGHCEYRRTAAGREIVPARHRG